MPGFNRLFLFAIVHFYLPGHAIVIALEQCPPSVHRPHLVFLEQHGDATGKSGNDLVLARYHGRDIDGQVAKEARKLLTRETGLVIQTGVTITGISAGESSVTVEYASSKDETEKLDVDKLIIAIGRVPNTAGLGAENVGLKMDERGYIEVDNRCRTNLPNIHAIGDVVRGPMLAHKASEEGMAVAETIAGQAGHVNLDTIPSVIYTSPEIAWVGKTEQELKAAGVKYKAGQFPFMANGRARALGETGGFVKVLADATTDRILGIHMIGPYVSEMIAEAVVAMEFAASSEDIARIVHAHPSLSEVLHEAALGVDKRAIHI